MRNSNDDEMTRRMLGRMRGEHLVCEGNEGYSEQNDENTNEGIPITDDVKFGSNVLSTEKDEIKTSLKSNVKFGDKPLMYYPDKNDLVLVGEIMDMNGLKFRFSFNDPSGDGCYIWADGIQLSDTNSKKISQIRNVYENWKERWLKNSAQMERFGK